jgi:hypothetical protein
VKALRHHPRSATGPPGVVGIRATGVDGTPVLIVQETPENQARVAKSSP